MDTRQLTTFCHAASNAAGPERIHAMLHERVDHRASGERIRPDRAPFAPIRVPMTRCDRATMTDIVGFPGGCGDPDAPGSVLKRTSLSRAADWPPACGPTDPRRTGAVPVSRGGKIAPLPIAGHHADRVGQVRR